MVKYSILLITFFSCSSDWKMQTKNYPIAIGDIEYDKSVDGDFERCGTFPSEPATSFANSYYGTGGLKYTGEMYAIKEHVYSNFKSPNINNETGFITIRFLINCKGKSGMFRVRSHDLKMNEFTFNKKITDQLLLIIKSLNGWVPIKYQNNNYDYYQYLTFKIINSEIKEIAP